MSNGLDDFLPSYGEGFSYAFDNDIMLNWYPKRVMSRTQPASAVLELGIGHGFTTNLFAQHFQRHVVIDGAPSIIEQFQRQFPDSGAEVACAYFENFDTEERFDAIVMGFVLEHVDDPGLVLRRYRRFLKPGGRCFIAVPNAESLHRRFGHAAGLLPDMMALGKGDLALGHKRLYTVESLTLEAEENGYTVVSKEGIFLKPMTTDQLRSLSLSAEILDGMCRVGIEYPELSAAFMCELVPVVS
ncbi:class I SAM-dependent methyltransferase [Pandoraea sputorum]|uniref:class I SAM-dependent methyltransferase n=1 Tax=Pandoraea sputorum TaxID=93222 RepID=UPI001E5720B3|nr:class I SAM-dependent methyltransferase [Pandoraea sputorum]MCE4061540.1 class I SAM-dependent methyltransferase [Pandoraea sputorum]